MNVGPLVVLDEIVLLVVVVFVSNTQVLLLQHVLCLFFPVSRDFASNKENPKRQELHTSILSFFIFMLIIG